MSNELLPCPFCGNHPVSFPSGDGTGVMIQCVTPKCVNPTTSWYGTGIAAKNWNRRAPLASSYDKLAASHAELVEALKQIAEMDGAKDEWDAVGKFSECANIAQAALTRAKAVGESV